MSASTLLETSPRSSLSPSLIHRLPAYVARPTLRRRNLIPASDLKEGVDPTDWHSTGDHPSFVIRQFIPAGWIRLRINVKTTAIGEMTLVLHPVTGGTQSIQLGMARTGVTIERYLRLYESLLQITFNPAQGPGPIVLHAFRINAYSVSGLFLRGLFNRAQAD